MIQVGRLAASGTGSALSGGSGGMLESGWADVTYHQNFPDDEVAVFTQVQTYLLRQKFLLIPVTFPIHRHI